LRYLKGVRPVGLRDEQGREKCVENTQAIMIVRLDEELKLARSWVKKSRLGEIKWASRLI
jgi:hypothetical protein